MSFVPWKIVRGSAAVAAAVVVYLVLVPQTSTDRTLLGSLVISRTADTEVPKAPALTQSIPGSSSSFAATRAAARAHPDETGITAREWYISSSAPPEVGVVVQLLPDAATAQKVFAEGAPQVTTVPQLSGETAATGTPFTVTGVPGGLGESFALTDSTSGASGPVGYAYKTVYRVGRVVVSELIASTSPTHDPTPAVRDAQAGRSLLLARENGFSLVRHHVPVVASVVYWVIAAVVVALAVWLPVLVVAGRRRRRERRTEAADRRAREEYLARGRRTVKRQRAPSWAKGRRR